MLVIGLVAAFLVPLLAMMFFFSAGDTPVESRADSASGAAQPRVPESPTEPPVAEGSETSAEAPATSGSVFLESQPPGATVRLGERGVVGTTPIEVGMVAPGSHTASLELEGHEAWRQEITVGPGERVVVSQALVPTPSRVATARQPERSARPPGRISVNSRPWSKVYLGRRLLGTTPIGRVQIPSGRQRLRLVDRDGNQHRRTVVVGPGEHVAQSYDLR